VSDCEHAWEKIGDTTFTGPTWCHVSDVLYCCRCKRYASRVANYLHFRPRLPAADLESVRAEETAARRKLIADHRDALGASEVGS